MAANGAKVAYADVDIATATESASKSPGAMAVRMDVSKETEVEEAIDKILQQFGHLDILVNNAGVNTLAHRVTVAEFPTHEWERILKWI